MNATLIIILSTLILGLSGLFSGLTLGLMSLSPYDLKRKRELGNKDAVLVYPLRMRGNELLVTLILCSVFLNSILTVVLDSWLIGVVTIITVTILITVFAEILPQAFLKKHGLKVGAVFAPILTAIARALSPIATPLGKLLDRFVGEEEAKIYSKEELFKILDEHEASEESDIGEDELSLVKHALSFRDKKVQDIMTPRTAIIAIKESEVAGPVVLKELHDSGHSRFPVYRHNLDNIVGILNLADLTAVLTTKKVRDFSNEKDVHYLNQNQPLTDALIALLDSKQYLYIVLNNNEKTVGIVTLRDVVEEIMDKQRSDKLIHYDDKSIVAKLSNKKQVKENANE